jgi:predicted metal-dependent phosphoesterase TrpH
MKADLHMHSTASDGRYSATELVDLAQERGVDVIAITDHDVVAPLDDVIRYAEERGIRVLPAIELSTVEDNKSVHLLGYFTDASYQNEELRRYFSDIQARRERRARTIIDNLKRYHDIEITYEDVLRHTGGIIARPHIAKAIHDAYPEYDMDAIFESFIGDQCPSYVPSVELPVQEGIDLLRRYGCVVVLAHPTLLKPHIKDKVLSYGFDGLEAYYPLNRKGETKQWLAMAAKRDWIVTAGSDFHGIPGDTKHGMLGDLTLEGDALEAFFERYKKVQQTNVKSNRL